MYSDCLRRLAAACRRPLVPTIFTALLALLATPAFADVLRGQVVDPAGRPIPRAYVRVLSQSGAEISAGFTNESGQFALESDPSCRVEVSLTGFQTATTSCSANPLLQIALAVTPIRESVIVSATRTAAPLGQVGASATIFTEEDLDREQQPLLADLLVGTPGAAVLRSGGPGTVTSLFVRGGESDYNKVLLDGVPLNEPGGGFYLNNLSTENLERVEVVRGAYSSLFGSDAMSSVVQLFTKHGNGQAQRPQASAQVDGGTYGTLHASASVHGATSRLDYSAGAARLDSDNRVPNSALENTTLSGSLGITLGSATTLRAVARAEREHVGTPGTTAFGRPDLDAFFERHDAIGSLILDQQITPRVRQRASYSLAASNQQSTNLLEDRPYIASFDGRVGMYESTDFLSDTVNEYRRHHASYQADLHLSTSASRGDQTLTLLADWDGERLTAIDRLSPANTRNARNNFGVAAQHQMLWRRLFITVGGRLEQNESFGTAFTPRGSVVYVVRQGSNAIGDTRIKAGAGIGVKEPTLAESFSLSPYALGNPRLDAERSRSAEVGIDQRFAHDRARVELTYFDNRFTDVVQLITTNPATFEGQYFNTGAERARGLELGAEVAPTATIRARAGYTFLDGRVVESAFPTDIVFGLGNELFRRPRHSGSVGVTARWHRIEADVNGAFIGKFVDSDFFLFDVPLTENPGHTIWNTRVSLTLTRRVTGLLMIDNLTNQDYSEPFGYQPLLRAVRAGLRVGF